MTNKNKEAADILRLMPKQSEAIKKAIEVLEQEPCEDCISRKDLYNALYDRFHDEDSPNNITEVTLGSVRNFVKDFPSVTPKPKTGHWEWELEDWNKWTCSECGFTKRTDVHVRLGYNYCPNCGAEMESEDDE